MTAYVLGIPLAVLLTWMVNAFDLQTGIGMIQLLMFATLILSNYVFFKEVPQQRN